MTVFGTCTFMSGEPMEFLFAIFVVAAIFLALYLRAEILDLRAQQEKDSSYFEWWLRSMEARKEDSPEMNRELEDDE